MTDQSPRFPPREELDRALKWAREVVLHGAYDEQTRNAVVGTIESARFFIAAQGAENSQALREAEARARAETFREAHDIVRRTSLVEVSGRPSHRVYDYLHNTAAILTEKAAPIPQESK